MGRLLVAVFIVSLLRESVCVQVVVPKTEYSTTLFASVTLRCDYSTSANIQDILVTWRFKSFCQDPVLNYYSTAYQSALQLGQDPSNDCPDRQRTIRTVVQKKGGNEAILGGEYVNRKITIQNKADLVISEVMWWDNGVYLCSVDAAGDTSGNPVQEVKLIVYNWLTVLLIIIGAFLLILLFGICCCQCCPQKCCCYVRCPCCPQKCCCPEKAMMEHRMMKEAKQAWQNGQVYMPLSHVSSQMNPTLYGGSNAGKSIQMKPMPLPAPYSPYSFPPPSVQGNHPPGNHMIDYLENQVRGLDLTSPLMQSQPAPPPHMQQMPPPPQQMPINIPYSPGPPSMISALDEPPRERRIITLPPIREQPQGRGPPPAPKTRPPSSSESNRSGYSRRDERGGADRRYPSPSRSRGLPRSYSEESLDGRSRGRSRGGMNPPRSRSRDDLFDSRSRDNYSPPASRRSRGSFSSDEETSSRGRRGGGSWTEYEPGQKPGPRRNDPYSDKSSRGGTSIVI
uniref:Immunoglobulin-like domain-containing receptor 1 n=1 Tax=Oryzias latipes TaxID=8090 RepID=A0A3P9MKT4_ORYLA